MLIVFSVAKPRVVNIGHGKAKAGKIRRVRCQELGADFLNFKFVNAFVVLAFQGIRLVSQNNVLHACEL